MDVDQKTRAVQCVHEVPAGWVVRSMCSDFEVANDEDQLATHHGVVMSRNSSRPFKKVSDTNEDQGL